MGALITVSIITLLAVIIIPKLMHSRIAANESTARAALKEISAALELYAEEDNRAYPTDLSVLISAEPCYLNKNYIADSPFQGYSYVCESLEVGGYSCSATPQVCGQTGLKIYKIRTGSVFSEADCKNFGK